MPDIITLLAEDAVITGTNTNLIITLVSGLFALAGVWVNNYFKNKKKDSDAFTAVIGANTEYREEIRRDLKDTKKELQDLHGEVVVFEKNIEELKNIIRDLIEKNRQCEERFLRICSFAPIGIFRTDKEGLCTYVNKKWCEITGLNPEEATGHGWKKALHPDDYDIVQKNWRDIIENHLNSSIKFRFKNQKGNIIFVYGNMVREECRDGKLIGYIGCIIEETDKSSIAAF